MPRIALERHAFAPELNKAHVMRRGRVVATLAAPGCTTIADARRALFAPVRPFLAAHVQVTRAAPWAGLNRAYGGAVTSRAAALALIRDQIAPRHAGGPLADGRTLPPPDIRVRFRMIG